METKKGTNRLFIPDIEYKSQEEIKNFQEIKLKQLISYLFNSSKFYKNLFEQNGIKISDIKTLEDLHKIPFTHKNDIAKKNDEFLCVDKSKVVDYITTSGTLGNPVIFSMTEKDLERLAYNEAISLTCSGCTEEDIIQLTTTIDKRFMAGLAYFLGARKLGAGIIRVGAGMPELQWDTINRIKPSVLIAVPSFIVSLVKYAEQNGIDYQNSSLKKVICIGEPMRKADLSLSTLAEKIKSYWDIELYSTYASTEMATAFAECEERRGGHHHPELIICEFVDEKDRPVGPGEPGELVITTLGVEGMPLLRFKTGDICAHYTGPCKCGRNSIRLGPVLGRKQQMIKLKGTTVYPPAIFELLDDIPEVDSYVIEVSTNEIGTDDVLVRVAGKEMSREIEKKIKDHFRAKIRVAPNIKFESHKDIEAIQNPENSRKTISFIDKRK